MKLVSKRILQVLAAIMLFTAILIAGLLSTERGTRALMNTVESYHPAGLSVSNVNGTVFSGLQIEHIQWLGESEQININNVDIRLSLRSLLVGYLNVRRLTIDEISVQTTDADDGTPNSFDLKMLEAPINLVINRGSVSKVVINEHTLERIELSGSWVGRKFTIENADVSQGDNRLQLSGDLLATKRFTHNLRASVRYDHHRFEMEAKGDDGHSLVVSNADGHTLDVKANLHGLPSSIGWNAEIWLNRIEALHLGMLGESLLHDLTIKTKGDWHQFTLEAFTRLETLDEENLHIDAKLLGKKSELQIQHAIVEHRPTNAKIVFSGDANIEGNYWLDSEINNVRWPLDPAKQQIWLIESGRTKLQGTGADLSFSSQMSVSAGQQALEISSAMKGNLASHFAGEVDVKTQYGQSRLVGRFDTQTTDWSAKANFADVDPKAIASADASDLSGAVTAEGNLVAKRTLLIFDELGGLLMGRNLSGTGRVEVNGSKIDIDNVNLTWGQGKVKVSADIGADSIDSEASFERLSLLPNLTHVHGLYTGQIKVTGTHTQPHIAGSINAENVGYANTVSAKQLSVTIDAGLLTGGNQTLRAEAKSIIAKGQPIDQLLLTATGDWQNMSINLQTLGQHQLQLQSSASITQNSATGLLSTLAYENTQNTLYNTSIDREVTWQWSNGKWQTTQFCALVLKGQVCGDTSIDAMGLITADLKLQDLNLGQRPRPNAKIARLNGIAKLSGHYDSWSGKINLSTTAGALGFIDRTHDGVRFRMHESTVSATLTDNRLTSNFDVSLNFGLSLTGEFNMPSIFGEQIVGNGQLYSDDLTWLERFWPDMQDTYGIAWADVTWRGTVQQPQILGTAELIDLGFNLGRYGTAVSAVNGTLEFLPKGQANFEAKAQIGGQFANATAEIDYFNRSLYATIEGERLIVANTDELYLEVQPDIEIIGDDQGVLFRGAIAIPQANVVRVATNSSAAATSGDVIVHDASSTRRLSLPIEADLELRFGDQVLVTSKDFMARLMGSLEIQKRLGQPYYATGNIYALEGFYRVYGQAIDIKRGRVFYRNGPATNPNINLNVERRVDATTVGAEITGTLARPKLELYSSPSMPDSTVLSYLMTGRAVENAQAGQLALLQVGAMISSTFLSSGLGGNLGLSSMTLTDEAVSFGRQFGDKLFVALESNFSRDQTELLMRYSINERTSLELINGEDTTIDILYQVDKD